MFKSYYCPKLEKTLHFLPDGVKFCCSCAEGAGYKINNSNGINKKDIITFKKKFINMLKRGIIPKECNGCIEYREKTLKEQFNSLFKKSSEMSISHIIVDHFKECDCVCIYCSQKKLYPNTKQNYELLPIIKDLYNENIIDTFGNLKVEFQGGNISVLKEFEALTNEFKIHNCDDYVVLFNGIKYIDFLESLSGKSHICISLDSGTKETFAKIKSVDAFDKVIENIKRLKVKTKAQISLKYIIVKNVNDNTDELRKFLEIVKEIGGINPVVLEIDYNNTLLSSGEKFLIPSHYYDLFNFAEKYCKENNIQYMVYPYTKSLLEKGYSI